MKQTMLFFSFLFISAMVFGQAYEGAVEYQSKLHPAAVIDLPYAPSVVDAAMDDFLSKKGKSRKNDIKGFSTFRNTQPLQNDSANSDLYFKTERKSRKEKEVTVVSLLLTPTEAKPNTGDLHHLNMADAMTYLNELATSISAYNLELTIKDQNEAVIKAESKYKNLAEEGDDLERKRAEIDKKIADNKNDQQQQLKALESKRKVLSDWIVQRKS